MKRIKKSPLMFEYARIFGLLEYKQGGEVDCQEVCDWINDYVNHPQKFFCEAESTPEERLESIKTYVKREIESSITHKIKGELHDAKRNDFKSPEAEQINNAA